MTSLIWGAFKWWEKKGRVPQITYRASLTGRTQTGLSLLCSSDESLQFQTDSAWQDMRSLSSGQLSALWDVYSVRGVSPGRWLGTPHTQRACRNLLLVAEASSLKPRQIYNIWQIISVEYAMWLLWCLKHRLLLFSERRWQRLLVVESTLEISLLVLATVGRNNRPVKPVILNWGFPTNTWGSVFSERMPNPSF